MGLMQEYVVTVKSGSKKGPLVEADSEGVMTAFVRERAVDGKANEAVIALLAEHFGVAKADVAIVRGHQSRHKLIRVS